MTRKRQNYRVDENGDVWRKCRKCGEWKHQSQLKKRPNYPIGYEGVCKPCYNKYYRIKAKKKRLEQASWSGKELMVDKAERPNAKGGCSQCPAEDVEECRARVSGQRPQRYPLCFLPDRADVEYMYAIQNAQRQTRRKSERNTRSCTFDGCAYLQVETC